MINYFQQKIINIDYVNNVFNKAKNITLYFYIKIKILGIKLKLFLLSKKVKVVKKIKLTIRKTYEKSVNPLFSIKKSLFSSIFQFKRRMVQYFRAALAALKFLKNGLVNISYNKTRSLIFYVKTLIKTAGAGLRLFVILSKIKAVEKVKRIHLSTSKAYVKFVNLLHAAIERFFVSIFQFKRRMIQYFRTALAALKLVKNGLIDISYNKARGLILYIKALTESVRAGLRLFATLLKVKVVEKAKRIHLSTRKIYIKYVNFLYAVAEIFFVSVFQVKRRISECFKVVLSILKLVKNGLTDILYNKPRDLILYIKALIKATRAGLRLLATLLKVKVVGKAKRLRLSMRKIYIKSVNYLHAVREIFFISVFQLKRRIVLSFRAALAALKFVKNGLIDILYNKSRDLILYIKALIKAARAGLRLLVTLLKVKVVGKAKRLRLSIRKIYIKSVNYLHAVREIFFISVFQLKRRIVQCFRAALAALKLAKNGLIDILYNKPRGLILYIKALTESARSGLRLLAMSSKIKIARSAKKIKLDSRKIYKKLYDFIFIISEKKSKLLFKVKLGEIRYYGGLQAVSNFMKYSIIVSAVAVVFLVVFYKNLVYASDAISSLPKNNFVKNMTLLAGSSQSTLPEAVLPEIDANFPSYVLVSPKENTTFSSENMATVKFIGKKEGESFQEGDVLIEFDCRTMKADLKKSEAQLEFAKIAYNSALKLESYGTISDYELVKARSELEVAAAEVEKIQAMLDRCIIKAPYNGSVSASLINIGETAKPGEPVLKIVNIENLELKMQIPSTWLGWLKIGSEFRVSINETQKVVKAKVSKINPEINSVSQTVNVIGVLVAPEPSLLPGMSGQAIFSTKKSELESYK